MKKRKFRSIELHGGIKEDRKMGRKKKCPKCGSKKIDEYSTPKKCKVCGFEWTGTGKKKTARKNKVRF